MFTQPFSRTKTVAVSLVALLTLGLIISPQARAELANLFGLPTIKVAPGNDTVTITDENGATLTYKVSGNVSFEREPQIGTMDIIHTNSLAEARAFIGVEGPLPMLIEGTAMLAYTEVGKQGELLMAGISQPDIGFWARYRPKADHQTQINYSSDWQVTSEQVEISGFPGLQITAKAAKGNTTYELWLLNGNWIYELRNDRGELQSLIKIVESLK